MRKFSALLIALCLCGCAAFAAALPYIDSAVSDTALVLKGIETTFDAYQTAHAVAPEDRAEYDRLLAAAYQTLTLGERAVADLHDIDQGQYDAAFKGFTVAFKDLTAFMASKGITPVGAGLVGAGTQGGDAFPVPRVIGLRVRS